MIHPIIDFAFNTFWRIYYKSASVVGQGVAASAKLISFGISIAGSAIASVNTITTKVYTKVLKFVSILRTKVTK